MRISTGWLRGGRALNFALAALVPPALASLIYSLVTAPQGGFDLNLFQRSAREFVDGSYSIGAGALPLYPPFAAPLFAPLALLPFRLLVVAWLCVNVAAVFLTLRFAINLYGVAWPKKVWLLLSAFVLAWAPFRVTLRLGQLSLIVTALLLGALLARQNKRRLLSGVLLGLSLWKYSLTLPFLLYFILKKEWKLVGAALMMPLILTEVFAVRMGISLIDALRDYVEVILHGQAAGGENWLGTTGTTEIKLLLSSLTHGNETLAFTFTIALIILALAVMIVVFSKTPQSELSHFAVLALFALWWSYHRVYDSVICVLPAALLIDFIVREVRLRFSWFWLGALGLLIISLPGLLTERFHLNATELSGNLLGWFGIHSERLMIFALFWSLLIGAHRWRGQSNSPAAP